MVESPDNIERKESNTEPSGAKTQNYIRGGGTLSRKHIYAVRGGQHTYCLDRETNGGLKNIYWEGGTLNIFCLIIQDRAECGNVYCKIKTSF